jgi:hypothetical protein
MATRPVIDTGGIADLLRDLRKIDKALGASLFAELRAVGNEARDKIRNSTAPPYGPVDSKGKIGRKRKSVKTGVKRGQISLYSNEPDAAVWHWGGTIKPRGVPITIPRTEFISAEVLRESEGIEEKLAGVLEGTARRYQFR